MHLRSSSRRHGRQGFTLVEVLLSLALLASLLLAMNQFILSMGELWGRNRQQRLFDQHVRAVTRHVDDLLQRGAQAPEEARRLRMVASPVPGVGTGPLLTFDLAAGDRLLPWPDRPLPDVQCALDVVQGQGLLLYWQSRWELDFERAAPRSTVISPLVGRVEYEYYRKESRAWETRAPAVSGTGEAPTVPARLRLHFQYDRYTATEVVTIPPVVPALPVF